MPTFLNEAHIKADYFVIENILHDICGNLAGHTPTAQRTITSTELKEKLLVCLDVCEDIIKREAV